MPNFLSFLFDNKYKLLLNTALYPFLLAIVTAIFSQYAYAHEDIDYSAYMQNIQKQIKTNWHPPKVKLSNRAQVIFSIDKKGNVPGVKISHSSENTEMDRSALKAVIDSQPFPEPPGNKDISIEFTFDYNVHHSPADKSNNHAQRIINSLFTGSQPDHKTKNDSFIWIFALLYVLFFIYRNFARMQRLNKNKEETLISSQTPIDKDKSNNDILD